MECNNTHCKRPAKPNRKLCESCTNSLAESKKRQNAKLREQGLCYDCRKPSNGKLRCLMCSLNNSVRKHSCADKTTELLELFNQQQGKCTYTGLPIVIGESASIDHKNPSSKGGTNDLSNLHWVHTGINRLKGTMNHDEFLVFIQTLRSSLLSKYTC